MYSKLLDIEHFKVSDLHNEESTKKQIWSEIETINLLKGVNQWGENEWKEILDKLNFQSNRSCNDLSSKWREIKRVMIDDLQLLNKKYQKIVTKHEWIRATLKKLQIQNHIYKDESFLQAE